MPNHRAIPAIVVACVLALVAGCSPSAAWCAKRQECNDRLEDDSYGVCVEDLRRADRSLRANDEEDCHRLADAQLAFDACRATLSCRDVQDGDYDACDDERDRLADAFDDAGGECLSTN